MQLLTFKQQHYMHLLHRLGFKGVWKEDVVLWSDSKPHQGAFEGLSGRINQENL